MTVSPCGPDLVRMKRTQTFVLALTVIALGLAATGVAGAARTATSTRLDALDSELLVQINTVRRAHQLAPLKLATTLSVVADQHTNEMGTHGYFAHDSLDHTVSWKRIERSYPSTGYHSWSVGENLLYVGPTVGAAEAVKMWMNSPAHRANLLDPTWREIGIATRHFDAAPGVYGGDPVTILTTDFGARN